MHEEPIESRIEPHGSNQFEAKLEYDIAPLAAQQPLPKGQRSAAAD